MRASTSLAPRPLIALAALALVAGCGDLEPLDTTGGGGSSTVPPDVRAAFAGSCATAGCHDAATHAGNLSLADADLDSLVGAPSSAGIPMVTIGDIAESYIAIKMLPDDVRSSLGVERAGARMPTTGDFTNPNNQLILAWIAGAEFPSDTGDTTSGGDGMVTFADDIWPLFEMRCIACHGAAPSDALNGNLSFTMADAYDKLVGAASIDVPSMNQIEPNDPANSYTLHKLKNTQATVGGAGMQMPIGAALDDADIQMVEDWINAGAPM
ncbi:MAG: hypothetical protein H6710_01245 [Myxococcales bacterium]|nr:hypothetical protein [Myxococcales bacterium]MCB9702967.1 hypothetical protein [Myxococcales bacterium]